MAKKPNFRKLYRDLSAGKSLRDVAIANVLKYEDVWKLAVFSMIILKLPAGWQGIGEDIRIMAVQAGIPLPHAPQCWGGYINGLIKGGYLVPLLTIPHKPMQVPSSHARHSQLLERWQ